VFLSTSQEERSPAFSPDGRFIVYSSDQTGRWEIYVRPFTSKEPEFKISRDGGRHPRWRSPGEIVFLSLDGKMMSASVSTGNTFQHLIPQPLFDSGLPQRAMQSQEPYDAAKNGQRFLIPVLREREQPESITILTNWTERLRK
jgi:serine/threonine-protein kinase